MAYEREEVEFVCKVLVKLPSHEFFEHELEDILFLKESEFTLEDAIKFMKCREEVNWKLDEVIALRRMRELVSKYPKYSKGKKCR